MPKLEWLEPARADLLAINYISDDNINAASNGPSTSNRRRTTGITGQFDHSSNVMARLDRAIHAFDLQWLMPVRPPGAHVTNANRFHDKT